MRSRLPLAAAVLLLVGCGGGDDLRDSAGNTPGQVVLIAYGAALDGDVAKANGHTTERFRPSADGGDGKSWWAEKLDGVSAPYELTVVEERLDDGGRAHVTLKTPKTVEEIDVALVGGEWKLD